MAKCSTYVHSHKLGTQSVNTTPFCASTQAMVPKHQVWIAMQLAISFFFHKKVAGGHTHSYSWGKSPAP